MMEEVGLVLVEVPLLVSLLQHHDITVKHFYLHTDVVERLEAEGFLYCSSIRFQSFDGVALYEKTVTLVLEVAIDICLGNTSE